MYTHAIPISIVKSDVFFLLTPPFHIPSLAGEFITEATSGFSGVTSLHSFRTEGQSYRPLQAAERTVVA